MTVPTFQKLARSQSALSTTAALRLAWLCWAAFLIVPFSVVLWTLWHTAANQNPLSRSGEERWFVAAMVYLVLITPAAFFWREHIFKGYRDGRPMSPGKYLVGMITVWLAPLTAGIFSLVGCVVIGSMLPNLIPAFLSLLLFVMLSPTGSSIVRRVGTRRSLAANG